MPDQARVALNHSDDNIKQPEMAEQVSARWVK